MSKLRRLICLSAAPGAGKTFILKTLLDSRTWKHERPTFIFEISTPFSEALCNKATTPAEHMLFEISELTNLYDKVMNHHTHNYIWDCSFDLIRIYAKSRGIEIDVCVDAMIKALQAANVTIETINLRWDRDTCIERKSEEYAGPELQTEIQRIDACSTLPTTKPKESIDVLQYIFNTCDGLKPVEHCSRGGCKW